MGRSLLLRGERIDGRAVLGAVIVTLTHALRRVMVFPEHLEQLFIADDARVIHHTYRFSMTGLTGTDFAVGWVRRISSGVARSGAVHARQLPEQAFYAPEAAHGKQGDLHSIRNVCH